MKMTLKRFILLVVVTMTMTRQVMAQAPYRDMCDEEEGPSQRGLHRCGLTEFDVEDSRLLERKRFVSKRWEKVYKYNAKNALSFLTKTSRGIPTNDFGLHDVSTLRG